MKSTSGTSAESVVIRCETCQQKIWIPEAHLGDSGRCPRCKTPFEPVRRAQFEAPASSHPFRWRLYIAVAAWIYLAVTITVAAIIHGLSEAWAVNTLALFAPRWIWAVPMAVLVPAGLFAWRRALPPLAGAFILYLLFIEGIVVRWPSDAPESMPNSIRLVTCNVGGGQLNRPAFKRYLERTQADIVVLQEWSDTLASAVFGDLARGPWTTERSGGITVASRLPITAKAGVPYGHFELPGTAGSFEVTAPSGPFQLVGVHLPTAREGIEAVVSWRIKGLPALRSNSDARERASLVARRFAESAGRPLIVAGDFNLPPESSILKRHWGFLKDAFAVAGSGVGHTKHTRWHGVRIDHIRFDEAWDCQFCQVGDYVGSDHRPVLAVLVPLVPSKAKRTDE